MRSEHHRESFRDANPHTEGTAPGDAVTADRTIATPAALWLEAAESMFKWYDAMVGLAFGIGRMDGRSEARSTIAPSSSANPAPHVAAGMSGSGEAQSSIASPAPAALTPTKPSPIVALHSVATAPVKRRPKRRKTASRGKTASRRKNKARSPKLPSMKRRYRRAA